MLEFKKKMQKQFERMCQTNALFVTNVDTNILWEKYLAATNGSIFRDPNSSTYNCKLCNNFIRRYGNIVAINPVNHKLMTLFDFEIEGEYSKVPKTLKDFILGNKISDFFIETYAELNSLNYEKCSKNNNFFRLGLDKNHKKYSQEEVEKFGVVNIADVYTFNHMSLSVPKQFVYMGSESKASLLSKKRAAVEVFKRGLDEISIETLDLVIDLINQKSLLNGLTYLEKVKAFKIYANVYKTLKASQRENWVWFATAMMAKTDICGFRNDLIGVLCTEIATKDLEVACENWNKRVDPVNFMQAVKPYTEKQRKEVEDFIINNDYESALDRRCATLDDIMVSEIKYLSATDKTKPVMSVFDKLPKGKVSDKKSKFENLPQYKIEEFMSSILPTCSNIEVYLENRLEGNMVTMTTAKQKDSKPMFKWHNNYSWAYKGNLSGISQIKEAVKTRGGRIDAPVRISLSFPNTANDYDLHVAEPNNGSRIYYGNLREYSKNGGMLDLDAQGRDGHKPPELRVENIFYKDVHHMSNGLYNVFVNNYSQRSLNTTFKLEVEILGNTILLESISTNKNGIDVGVIIKNNEGIVFQPTDSVKVLSDVSKSKKIYNLDSNEFHPVKLMCTSPNHWQDNVVGDKHYFFMLENCLADTDVKTFHNDHLNAELHAHRRVLGTLASLLTTPSTPEQLSGVGFNATITDKIIVKANIGGINKVIQINF